MKRRIEIVIIVCSVAGIVVGSANCIGANVPMYTLRNEKEIEELITLAPEMILSQTNDIRVYREQVCRKISEEPDEQARYRYFRKFMESACGVDFERIEVLQQNQNDDGWIRERQKANLRLGTYYRLEGFAEEIWNTLFFLESKTPPGREVFQPWFILMEKLKAEEKSDGKRSLRMFERNVDQVERLYLFFYLTDPRRKPDPQDRAAVEERFKQVVGRPIRSAEQYKADARRRVMKNIQEQKEREEAKRKRQEQQKLQGNVK